MQIKSHPYEIQFERKPENKSYDLKRQNDDLRRCSN